MPQLGEVFASPATSARLEIVRMPSVEDRTLEVRRTIPRSTRRQVPHVHLNAVEVFVVEQGIADAELDGRSLRLGANDRLTVPMGVRHVNPFNRGDADLVVRHAVGPVTPGFDGYVATLGAYLREDRDQQGELPALANLAVLHATRSQTWIASIPVSLQRRVLYPAAAWIARLLGYPLSLPHRSDSR